MLDRLCIRSCKSDFSGIMPQNQEFPRLASYVFPSKVKKNVGRHIVCLGGCIYKCECECGYRVCTLYMSYTCALHTAYISIFSPGGSSGQSRQNTPSNGWNDHDNHIPMFSSIVCLNLVAHFSQLLQLIPWLLLASPFTLCKNNQSYIC